MEHPETLTGKTALISGGTTGIGRATALSLARQGVAVFIFGRHQRELSDALADAEKTAPGKVTGVMADQAEAADVARVFVEFRRRHARLDFLINNAAVAPESLEKESDAGIDYAIRANLTGYLLCTRHALKLMGAGGHIVNIGSISAEKRGAEGEIYTATKSGIRGYSESLRKTCGERGIRVTLIEPGWVGTDMTEEPPEKQREYQGRQEMMKAEDIAECILFSLTAPLRCDVAMLQVRELKEA